MRLFDLKQKKLAEMLEAARKNEEQYQAKKAKKASKPEKEIHTAIFSSPAQILTPHEKNLAHNKLDYETFKNEKGNLVILPRQEVTKAPVTAKPETKIILDQYQEVALNGILAQKYSVLVGAAGTGKTTTEQFLIEQLSNKLEYIDLNITESGTEELLEVHEPNYGLPICLCAFMGRAVQMMKSKIDFKYHAQTKTIHATLGYAPVWYTEKDPETGLIKNKMRFEPSFGEWRKLPYKVYIIDECGTAPVYLWNQLKAAMIDDARVIMIGDINQLPPPYGRSILGYAMTKWPTFALEKIHRQAEGSPIIENAHRILQGLEPIEHPGIFDIIDLSDNGIQAKEKVIHTIKLLNKHEQFNEWQDGFIVPQNHGILGQNDLNEILVYYFNKASSENRRQLIKTGITTVDFAVGDKVMLLANINELGLTNGMMGKVALIRENSLYCHERAQTIIPETVSNNIFDGGIEELKARLAKIQKETQKDEPEESMSQRQSSHIMTIKFENGSEIDLQTAGDFRVVALAYAFTCHKSQGGEYPTVIIVCHSTNHKVLCREWLYTAITRAQKRVIFLRNKRGLKIALKTQRLKGATINEKIKKFIELETKNENNSANNTDNRKAQQPDLPAPSRIQHLSAETIKSIHTAAQTLAGTCDYAATLDGQGFNKFDASFGHSIANANQLTEKQALSARKIMLKYKYQLGDKLFLDMFELDEKAQRGI